MHYSCLNFYEGLVLWRAHSKTPWIIDNVFGTVLGTYACLISGHDDYYLLLLEGWMHQVEVLTENQKILISTSILRTSSLPSLWPRIMVSQAKLVILITSHPFCEEVSTITSTSSDTFSTISALFKLGALWRKKKMEELSSFWDGWSSCLLSIHGWNSI